MKNCGSTLLTAQQLRTMLHYDPKTGAFTWIDCAKPEYNGRQAGSPHKSGALVIKINGRHFYAHRLAWLYVTGSWPENLIDHRDGVPSNNRWVNLRDATHAVNQQNKRVGSSRGTKSGMLGAHYHSRSGRYEANIVVTKNGEKRKVYLGLFDTAELAHEAYVASKRQMHPGCTI